MRAAHYWGIWPPSKFWEASVEDRALALVTYEYSMKIDSLDAKFQSDENERKFRHLSPGDSG